MVRLAAQVNWRIFVVGNTLYYVADRDLIHSKPRMVIDEDSDGIEAIDFDVDVHKRNNEATVTCEAARWVAPPGSVIKLQNMGPASKGDGRWLVWEVTRDLFTPTATITLKKPQAPKPEPAPEMRSVADDGTGSAVVINSRIRGIKDPRDRIVAAAKLGLKEANRLVYGHNRPIPNSLWSNNSSDGKYLITDCSGFACLVYKAAGMNDPNGTDYNGSAYTGTMMAAGHRVANPKPGDLVFYRSPEHVGVLIEDGYVIEFGGDPGPLKLPVHYRSDIIGFYTYDLSSATTPINAIKAPHGKHSPQNRGSA
jgi:hypothetical protein